MPTFFILRCAPQRMPTHLDAQPGDLQSKECGRQVYPPSHEKVIKIALDFR
jgi:hypothetical protein